MGRDRMRSEKRPGRTHDVATRKNKKKTRRTKRKQEEQEENKKNKKKTKRTYDDTCEF